MATSIRSPQECGVACDLCGSDRFTQLHEWPVGDFWNPATIPIAVWRCRDCGLVVLHPVPTAHDLPDAGDWWSPKRTRYFRRKWFKTRWARVRRAIFGQPCYRLIRATRRVARSGRLLDVGCGCGELLREAGRVYDCVGIEPSGTAATRAREAGFPVMETTFEDALIEESSFDVVTLDAVIEHVESPTRALAKVNSALRMNGIVVLTTPKFNGPAYRIHRDGWNGFRHGYHRFLFTGQTLGRCLEKTGFEVLRRPKRDRILDDALILWGRKVREAATGLSGRPVAGAA